MTLGLVFGFEARAGFAVEWVSGLDGMFSEGRPTLGVGPGRAGKRRAGSRSSGLGTRVRRSAMCESPAKSRSSANDFDRYSWSLFFGRGLSPLCLEATV